MDYHAIAVRQFSQRILPETDVYGNPLGLTAVWTYASVNYPNTFN